MFRLSEDDQATLLKIARDSVRTYLLGEPNPVPEAMSGILAEHHGAFVSIHKRGSLRGCIGNIRPGAALCRTVHECAVSAAVSDPRFPPMTFDELDHCDFEVSVLSPMEKVEHVESIEVGTHGLLISKGGVHGLLLPQVATAYNWSRERFLAETCRKAGLRADDWKHSASIFRFSAHVCSEKELYGKSFHGRPSLTT